MTPAAFLSTILVPGLKFMTATLGNIPGRNIPWENDDRGRLLQLAFAGQESNWVNEQQFGNSPGRGFYQFEPPTCRLVLGNPAGAAIAHAICAAASITATQDAVYGALLINPVEIAVPFARLDTWCDPRPLPSYGDAQAGWIMYDEEWRPGRPHPLYWATVYAQALAADRAWTAAQGAKA